MRMRNSPAPFSGLDRAMAELRVCGELAESVLDAAGSLFQLQEELDRISLRHGSVEGAESSPTTRIRHRSSKKSRKRLEKRNRLGNESEVSGGGREARDADSLRSYESSEQSSFVSSNSRYDSAIGSLHSQTDDDSLSSRLSISARAERRPPAYSLSSPLRGPRHHSVREAIVEQYYSPQPSVPTLVIAEDAGTQEQESLNDGQRDAGGNEPGQVVVMGAKVQLRQKKQRQKAHNPLTADDARKHFQWLESAGKVAKRVSPDPPQPAELESEGSSSTVVGEEGAGGGISPHEPSQREDSDSAGSAELSLNLSEFLPKKETVGEWDPIPGSHPQSMQVNMPQRYHTETYLVHQERAGQRRPPQRAPSILQRLRRRQGSFRREARPPQRRIPVQRSLSDRFVYHLKKKWETRPQENPISTPSHLRPIGRLLRTYAGRLHVVQLHKPADGHYGIYITQGADSKIFISRFATPTAEKFYAGLLSPGDELVSINKLKIRGKSMDFVYNILSQLNSVILAVVPVSAHRNW